MGRVISVFGGITGYAPLNSQELQESIQINHQQAHVPSSYHSSPFNRKQVPNALCIGLGNTPPVPLFDGDKDEKASYSIGNGHRSNGQGDLNWTAESGTVKKQPVPVFDSNKNESSNYFAGNSQWSNGQGDINRYPEGGKQPYWQRLRWTDEMVKVLITALSYVEEDAIPDSIKNKTSKSIAVIKGKWRAISKAMVEKGYKVSPQQCEDKFNDLNKRYKRLNDILGKGTLCKIVKNPGLLEFVSISNEAKVEAMKILGCKQFFYREMCSFHNKNRRYLPHDECIRNSVQSALKSKVKYWSLNLGMPAKRHKQAEDIGVSRRSETCPSSNVALEGVQAMIFRSLQLEEKRLWIQSQVLELERDKTEWLKLQEQEDMKLREMKLENDAMRLENQRLAYKLECRKRGFDRKLQLLA